MKLGIIGYGFIVQEFLPGLVRCPGLEVVAVLGKPERKDGVVSLCRQYGIPNAVFSFAELLETGVDTVYVAVPNHLHFSYAKTALEAGLNVIVEKPMVSNRREAQALRDLAVEKKLCLFEAITTLYLPGYEQIRSWLPRIGRVRMVHSHMGQFSRRFDAFCRGEVLPVFDPQKSGGALMDLNVYNIHFVSGLFGAPAAVDYAANMERGIDTSGILTMKYPDHVAVCSASKESTNLCGCSVHGSLGTIRAEGVPGRIGEVVLELRDGSVERVPDTHPEEKHILEFCAFRDTIHAKDLEFCYQRLDHSLQVMGILDEARRSAGIVFPADSMDCDSTVRP